MIPAFVGEVDDAEESLGCLSMAGFWFALDDYPVFEDTGILKFSLRFL